MTITTLQVLHGSPVTTVKELCSQYKISDRTARTVIKEIEENHKDGTEILLCWEMER